MTFDEAGRVWGIQLPSNIATLRAIAPDAYGLVGERELPLPWPPLSADEIASAATMAGDWELKPGMVPVMGDFHDLVCLRYVHGDLREVVIIGDDRTVHASFPSLIELIRNVKTPSDIGSSLEKGVIDSSSWLDF